MTSIDVAMCRVRWVDQLKSFALDFGDAIPTSLYDGTMGLQIICREILGNAPHVGRPESQGNSPVWIYRNVRIELGDLVGKSTVIINPQ
jgi:hypothetical protein